MGNGRWIPAFAGMTEVITLDFKKLKKIGRIDSTRFTAKTPMFSENQSQHAKHSDSHNFDEELEDYFDFDTELPELIQESVDAIFESKHIPETLLPSKATDFFNIAMDYVKEINLAISHDTGHYKTVENKLSLVSRALFLLVHEYGTLVAIQKLIDIWLELDKESSTSPALVNYINSFLSEDNFPLSCTKQNKTELTQQLKAKCNALLHSKVEVYKLKQFFNL